MSLRAYLISGFLWVVFACSSDELKPVLPYYNTPDFEPQFFENTQAAKIKITHQVKSFSFLDQHGQSISDTLLRGKVHVANFFFSRCTNICPNMIKQMQVIESEFGQNSEVTAGLYLFRCEKNSDTRNENARPKAGR